VNDVDPSPAAPREPAPRPFAPEPAFRDSLSPLARALDALASARTSRPAPFVVAVGGGVAVGKSTVARVLAEIATSAPGSPRVATLSLDSFLLSNAQLADAGLSGRKGFPESYDGDALLGFVHAVRAGEAGLRAPVYSHKRYDIVPGEHAEIPPVDLLVIEGLHALAPLPDGTRLADVGLYVDAAPDVVYGWYLTRFRALRVEARDDPTSFFHAWADMPDAEAESLATSVWHHINVVNLEQNIEPTRAQADVVIEKDVAHRVRLIDQTGRVGAVSPVGSG
jgi:type I pantothenate kinase